jgi:hypothetical protein
MEYDSFEMLDKYVMLFNDFCENLTGSGITRCYRGQTVELSNKKLIYLEIPRNDRTQQLFSMLTSQPHRTDDEIDQLLILYRLEIDLTKVQRDLPQYLLQYMDFYNIMTHSYCLQILSLVM